MQRLRLYIIYEIEFPDTVIEFPTKFIKLNLKLWQMSKREQIQEYKNFYKQVRALFPDDDIFPSLTNSQFEEYVSREGWMGIPSFSVSKKELTNSDQAHISIVLYDRKVRLFLWFNGVKAVNRFVNILTSYSQSVKSELVEILKSLNDKYVIKILYTEKLYSATADWKVVRQFRCNNLSEADIDKILSTIKETNVQRDIRQGIIKKSLVATIAISMADITLDLSDDLGVKDALKNIVNLTKICHLIMSNSEIRKIEKEKKRKIKIISCSDCGLIFPNNIIRTICPKCKVYLSKIVITKSEYDSRISNNMLFSEGNILG